MFDRDGDVWGTETNRAEMSKQETVIQEQYHRLILLGISTGREEQQLSG